jgi:hypothetical protein
MYIDIFVYLYINFFYLYSMKPYEKQKFHGRGHKLIKRKEKNFLINLFKLNFKIN